LIPSVPFRTRVLGLARLAGPASEQTQLTGRLHDLLDRVTDERYLVESLEQSELLPEDLQLMAWIAGKLKLSPAVPALLSTLEDQRKPEPLRTEAAVALGQIGGDGLFEHLMSTAHDPVNPSGLRISSLLAAARLPSNNDSSPFAAILSDPNNPPEVRGAAAEGLSYCAEAAAPILREALRDPDPTVRFWVIYALGEVGEARDIRLLEAYLQDLTALAGHGSIADEARDSIDQIRSRGQQS
jgi:HEAT repeat protein